MSQNELDAASVLRGARQHLSPSAEDGARVRAAVSAALAADPMGHRAPAEASPGAASALWGSASLMKLGLATALAAATGVGGYALGFQAGVAKREGRSVARVAERARVPTPTSTTPVVGTAPSPEPPVHEGAVARPARVASRNNFSSPAPAANKESPLELETRLLGRVERSLREHNPLLALGLLGELDRDVPSGELTEERQAARVMAHCALGSESAAKQARDFVARHARSAYLPRIEQACGVLGTEKASGEKTD